MEVGVAAQKRKELSKQELFDKDPDQFVNKADLFISIGKEGTMINNSIPRMFAVSAKYDLDRHFISYIEFMDKQSAEAKESGIVVPGGNGKNRL